MNLFKYEKHDKDTVKTRFDKGSGLYIGSVSRHRKDGKFQGFLVGIEKLYGTKTTYSFKHYKNRIVAEMSAIGDYYLFNHIAEISRTTKPGQLTIF